MEGIRLEEFMRLRELAKARQPMTAVSARPAVQEVAAPTQKVQKGTVDYYKQKTHDLRIQAGQGLPVRKMGNFVDVCA